MSRDTVGRGDRTAGVTAGRAVDGHRATCTRPHGQVRYGRVRR